MAREDLNPVEEARAVAALVEELGLTREEVGHRVGRSRVAISNLLRLLDLPDEALDAARARRPDRGPRPRAAAAEDHADRRRLARAAAAGDWSVRVLEAKAREAANGAARAGAPHAGRARVHPDQAAAADARSPTRSAPRWAPRSRSALAAPATRSSCASTTPTRPSRWPAASRPVAVA